MFRLLFGAVWTAFTVFCIAIVMRVDTDVKFIPCAILAMFFAIGVFLVVNGIKEVLRNRNTEKNGVTRYGIVQAVEPNGCSVNGREQLQAVVLVAIDGIRTERYVETVGFDWNRYQEKDFVLVKHLGSDINIQERIEAYEVPYEDLKLLTTDSGCFAQEPSPDGDLRMPETIIINGVEYIRK